MKHTLFNLFALLVVLSLALTACGSGATPAPTEAPVATTVVTEAPATTEAVTATTAPAVEKTALVGFTASLTGKLNVESTRQSNGFKLWMDQVNAAGGITLADGTVVKFDSKS